MEFIWQRNRGQWRQLPPQNYFFTIETCLANLLCPLSSPGGLHCVNLMDGVCKAAYKNTNVVSLCVDTIESNSVLRTKFLVGPVLSWY